ncbi:MAG: hypothetical protein FK733_00440 [Asgard group archaeon]|nr:hypothetical protein [Asgard group archaeon]
MKRVCQMYLTIVLILITLFSTSYSHVISMKYNDSQNTTENLANQTDIPEDVFQTNGLFSSDKVWSEPYQITSPVHNRGGYKIAKDNGGNYHYIYIKSLSLYGTSLYYQSTNDNALDNWTLAEQILQLDSEISEFDFLIDKNNTIHLTFIVQRETVWQLNYMYKQENDSIWSMKFNLDKTFQSEFYDHRLFLADDYMQIFWVSKERGTTKETLNSSIKFITKNLLSNDWSIINTVYESLNPINLAINQLKNNNTVLLFTNWDNDYSGNDIYYLFSNNAGLTWVNLTLLYEYPLEIDYLKIYPSFITGGFHTIWSSAESSKKVNHHEIFLNGTVRDSLFILNSAFNDGYFGGLYENETSGDMYVFYEEITVSTSNLYYRKRIGMGATWQIPGVLTSSGNAEDPIFLSNENDTALGNLFYLDSAVLMGGTFHSDGSFLNQNPLHIMTEDNEKGSIIVDSNNTIHYIWQHIGRYDNKIFYLTKAINGSVEIHGCITESSITDAAAPKLVIDSNDNLHCIFVADNIITGFDGLYYTNKLASQNNWSDAELVKIPENYAQPDNFQVVIDEADTIHIIWSETAGLYTNNLYYSYKFDFETDFTTITIVENEFLISSLYPSFVIDSYGTIHLVYVKIDRDDMINYVLYRSKTISLDWSGPLTLTASTQFLLIEPLIDIDSDDNLWMIYLRKYLSGAYFVADAILMEKRYSGLWFQNATLFLGEAINFHEFLITDNNTLVYIQHNTNIPTDTIPDDSFDTVLASYMSPNEDWSSREIIAKNLYHEFIPIGFYDNNSHNIFIVIYDKVGADTNIHIVNRQDDFDDDLLGNEDERLFNTDLNNSDCDLDGILDGDEVKNYRTHPNLNDTDLDNLEDGDEIFIYNSNPLSLDSDNDLLLDGDEIYIWFTNPILQDSDYDSLNDYDEIYIYGTDPTSSDTESDGMPDDWEIDNNLNPNLNDSYQDSDNDNLLNIEEYSNNTNPHLNDTDSDGLLDGEEVKEYSTDPLKFDTDEDSISDYDEVIIFGTNPLLPDSDQDGFTDREEINAGTDPLNPRNNIRRNKIRTISLSVIIPIVSIGSFYAIFEVRYRIKLKNLHQNEIDELQLEEEKLQQEMN